MLDELKKFLGINFEIDTLTDDSKALQESHMQLLKQGIALGATFPGNPLPQIWHVKNSHARNKGILKKQAPPAFTFTLYAGAGENHVLMEPWMEYIGASDAFIIVIDSLAFRGIKNFVDFRIMKNSNSMCGMCDD